MMKRIARSQETILIIIIVLFLALSASLFYFTAPAYKQWFLPGASGIILVLIILHVLLMFLNPQVDQLLLPIAVMLSILGLIGIYRIDPALAFRQWLWLLIGLVALGIVTCLLKNYRILEEYKYVFMFLALFFLVITAVVGTTIGGAKAWLGLGAFRFQPAEAVKLLVIFFLASYLQENREILVARKNYGFFAFPEPRALFPLMIMVVLSLGLLALQKDLGAAMIFFGIFMVMLYASTGRYSFLLVGSVVFAVGAVVAYFVFAHFRQRVVVWLNPWSKIDTSGYQIAQSLFALASGGLIGTGIGLGQPQVIPAAATDLIFAVLSEEMGLLGGIGIIVLFLLLSYRGFRAAMLAGNEFGMLLATGLTSLLALQTFIILSGVMKLLPLTGVTLPFVSYGGSSMIISYILLGLVMNVGAGEPKEA